MQFIEYSEKLEMIKYLAEHKRADSPCELVAKLEFRTQLKAYAAATA